MSKEKQVGDRLIRVVAGDITEQGADAIVYYIRPDLQLGSGFGTMIAGRGGGKIQEELNALAPAEIGQAVVTSGGRLEAECIIHAVGPAFKEPDTEGKLARTLAATFAQAAAKGVRKLALPQMGVGFYGIPREVAAKVTFDALQEFLATDAPIEQVTIVTNDSWETAPFEAALDALG
jgi:O-acetyl-ADP-ribose deacetylase (regulator of RNase III)